VDSAEEKVSDMIFYKPAKVNTCGKAAQSLTGTPCWR
jgi:hypothetical protein